MSPEDIAIVPADGTDMTVEGAEYVAGYDLEPDGLEFNLPATLRWTFSAPSGQFMVFHMGGGEIASLCSGRRVRPRCGALPGHGLWPRRVLQ